MPINLMEGYKLNKEKIEKTLGPVHEIAEKTRFSPHSAYQYLTGNKQSELFVRRLAELVNITFDEFLEEYADKTESRGD